MFDKEYSFKGSHAEKVIKLTSKFDGMNSLFQRNFDVYLMAPIVGFLYQKKGTLNTENAVTTKIFTDIQIANQDDLLFNYRLIMLLDKSSLPDIEDRIDRAFRRINTVEAEADIALYNQYVLGGVDILYEKLMEGVSASGDYLERLYDFMEEINDRYFQMVDQDQMEELCRLARR